MVGETVGVGCFSFIFQNACRAYIVFTINKCVTFQQTSVCLFRGGLGSGGNCCLAQAPLGLPWGSLGIRSAKASGDRNSPSTAPPGGEEQEQQPFDTWG